MNVDFDQQDIIIELPPEGKDGRSIHPAGEWSADAEYHTLDLVSYQGSSYIAVRSVPVGTLPTDAEYWQVVAEKGEPGASEWGEIAGDIADQTDLQEALDSKADASDVEEGFADVAEALAGKANADDVYTKTETDTLLGAKADVGDSYTKTEEDTLLNAKANSADVYTKTETDTLLADKADADDVYTKTEVDDALALKANSADVYTKTATDALLLAKAPVILSNASGSIASFTDGSASPVTALSVGIEPVQAGTGDPSPTNICPISGRTSATVTRTGKNLCPSTDWIQGQYSNGVWESVFNTRKTSPYISIKPNTTYTMSIDQNGTADLAWINFNYFDRNKNWLGSRIDNGDATFSGQRMKTFTIHNSNACFICLTVRAYSDSNKNIQNQDIATGTPQLELGSSASTYEPYQGQQVTIDLNGTRYGGMLDVLTGEMTVTKAIVDLGTLSWSKTNLATIDVGYYFNCKVSEKKQTTDTICSNYRTAHYTSIAELVRKEGSSVDKVSINAGADGGFRIIDSAYSDAATFKTAMSGVQLVYTLNTPLIVQLSSSQLSTLLGTNNIWADTGDTSVEYRADTKLYIDGVASATAKVTRQMIADSATADGKAPKSLATGDLIIVGDELRKATANIGNGSAITASNSTTATLADIIKALQ